jgi:hypothetical protein
MHHACGIDDTQRLVSMGAASISLSKQLFPVDSTMFVEPSVEAAS